jgi:bifunctional DNA-binding transcriptional regulator/antitoxin component of YhaV-PrlF toxin-antitoxin module
MTVLVKNKLVLQVPEAIQKKAGIRPGDLIEFTAAKGTITIRAATPSKESRVPLYTPTKAEAAAIRRGRVAFKRGDYVTLKQLHEELDAARHQARKKDTRKAS